VSRCAPLPLQFPLQLVEEALVGALGDELLGARVDHPRFMQMEGVEAHRILGVVLTPLVVRYVCEKGVVVALHIPLLYHEPGHPQHDLRSTTPPRAKADGHA
jgi:hypothetical protein